jgi:polar amino acid transport system substrate-binding protein
MKQQKQRVPGTSMILFTVVLVVCVSIQMALTAEQDTLAEIQKRGKVIVGTEAAFEPFEYVEGGKIVGYGADLLAEVVKDMGVQVEQLDLPWQGILPGVLAKKFDFIATSVTITKERSEKYLFTLPITEFKQGILVRKDRGYKSLKDLDGKIAGTQLNSAGEPPSEDMSNWLKAKGGKGFTEIKKYVGFPECYLEVANGRIDGCVQAKVNLGVIVKKQPDLYAIVDCPDEICPTMYFGWVVRPEDKRLRDQIDKTILRLHAEGKLKAMQEKWIGYAVDLPKTHVTPAK